MNSAGAVAVLVIVLAVVMVGMFMTIWSRDQKRSQKVADNNERLDTDNSSD
jgi:preprotein translocase subunit YajC